MKFYQKYLLPGIIFQSIVIAGGYGTGQEIMQYFLLFGPLEGILGLILTACIWSIICCLCFMFVVQSKAYDYRTFFQHLLGKYWFLFDIAYLILINICIAVIFASVGTLCQEKLNIPYNFGLLIPFVFIFLASNKKTHTLEKIFSFWSFLLYGTFIIFLGCCFYMFDYSILKSLPQIHSNDWVISGIKYAIYNLGTIPAMLFCLVHLQNNKEAILSGILVGPIAIIPGILLYLAMLGDYPNILHSVLPVSSLLQKIDSNLITILYAIVLTGTLIETGVGFIHSFSERIRVHLQEKNITSKIGKKIILLILSIAFLLAQFNLVNLITKGYGLITIIILILFILPLLTVGLYKIIQANWF